MDHRDQEIVPITLGGMDTRVAFEPNTAALIDNMHHHPGDGAWSRMEGSLPYSTLSSVALSFTWFRPRPGESYLVVERRLGANRSRLVRVNPQSQTESTIEDRRRVESDFGQTERFLEINRWLYYTSAFNAFRRWNGRRAELVGFDRAPPSPEAWGPDQGVSEVDKFPGKASSPTNEWDNRAQRGVGERASSTTEPAQFRYAYGLTDENELGAESPMSSLAFVSGENDLSSGPAEETGLRLIRLRVGQRPSHAVRVTLWRSQNLAGTVATTGIRMYRHSTWGAHGFDFVDHKSDRELGLEHDPDSVGLTPQGARAVAQWQGMLWLGGMPDEPATLRYSHATFLEQWPEVNRLRVGSAQSGSIVALQVVARALLVFMEHGTYLVKGNPTSGFVVETVDAVRGTSAPRGVASVPGVGVFFIHESGPHLVVGTTHDDQPIEVRPIAHPIQDFWTRRTGRRMNGACACHWPEHDEVWFHVPDQGDDRPTLGFVYHLTSGQWSIRRGWKLSELVHYRGRLYGTSWSVAAVHQFTRGSRSSALGTGSPIEATYVTNPTSYRHPVTFHGVTALTRAYGSGAGLEVSTRVDAAETWTVQTTTERPLVPMQRSGAEWGTAVWSATELYQDNVLTRIPASAYAKAARLISVRVRADTPMYLFGLELQVQKDRGGPPDRERRA